MAPEAGLLNLNRVIDSQNALYQLIRTGASACDGGIGPYWSRGTYISCGNRDGLLTYTQAHLDYAPVGDASSVVGQLATILTADRLSARNRAAIEAAYSANLDAAGGGAEIALQVAQALMVTTPEFHATNRVAASNEEREITPRGVKDDSVPYKGGFRSFVPSMGRFPAYFRPTGARNSHNVRALTSSDNPRKPVRGNGQHEHAR